MRDVRVAVVGSGFGGLGTAIRLREAGIEDFVVLERAHELGGTWRENTYPGCACDVPSHLYSFSFAPNPDWSQFFAPQGEILDYLRRVARERGITDHIVFGAEVRSGRWDDDEQRWLLDTSAGEFRARAVIVAAGALSEPSIPDLPGLGSFAGKVFHSAQWDHDHDLGGERVAVIGTGASAAQFIPYAQRTAGQLDVYQRTPGWILPRGDRATPRLAQGLFRRAPFLQRGLRSLIYYALELLVIGLTIDQRVLSLPERIARNKLRAEVPDPQLRAKLIPDYRIGCKRIIFSDDYLPALTQPNVELITTGIESVDEHGIRTVDGRYRPVDTVILGTGFKVTDPPMARRLTGRDGRTLSEAWQEQGMRAYVGTVVSGFPNLFFLVGPNTSLGNNSMINIIEAQLVFVLDALAALDAPEVTAIDVRRAVEDRYNVRLQHRMAGTVWTNGGCNSWYLSADGSNRTLWPSFSDAFKRRLARFDLRDFELVGERAVASQPTAAASFTGTVGTGPSVSAKKESVQAQASRADSGW
jgi:cation diffusion facilitator CzcD-associated flavoprotein CzcO